MNSHTSCFLNCEELVIVYALVFKGDYRTRLHELKNQQLLKTLSWNYVKETVVTSRDTLNLFIWYYENIIVIRNSSKIPISFSFTYELLKAVASETINYDTLSLALVRCLNQIVDLSQNTREHLSFVHSLKRMRVNDMIADLVSETRHAIVHKAMPCREHVDLAAIYFLMFLQENFWEKSIASNLEHVSQKRLEWTLEKMSKVLKFNIASQVMASLKNSKLTTKALSGKGRSQGKYTPYEFECQIKKELDTKYPSALALNSIINDSKLPQKKYKACFILVQSLVEASDAKVGMKIAEFIGKYFLEHVNVSEFRSCFSKKEFCDYLRHILVFKSTRKDFEDFWTSLESHYSKILLTSKFIAEWTRTEKGPIGQEEEFDVGLFKRLDNKYNACEIFEMMNQYYRYSELALN
jgi:hypothetical protein